MQAVPQASVAWRLSLLKHFAIAPHQLGQLRQPILLIAGAGDRLLPSVEEVQRLEKLLPNARSLILPESGHACLLEQDLYLDEILQAQNFLETHHAQGVSYPHTLLSR